MPEVQGLYDNRVILVDSSIKLGESGQILINKQGKNYVGTYDGNVLPLISEEHKEAKKESLFEHIKDKNVRIVISDKLKDIEKNFNNEIVTETVLEIIADDKNYKLNAVVELGGITRRKICRLPPLKFNMKKPELEELGFKKGNDKMKIVFQCNSSGTMSQSIREEKFIYDLYELVSEYGHQAKLIEASFSDDDKVFDAFILESDNDMEDRTKTMSIPNSTISTDVILREEYLKMCLFQFMIANTDWSARKGHNTEIVQREEDKALIIVPYDFDYAGIIDNDYAVPSEKLPIRDVRERYFMDKKVDIEELNTAVQYFLNIEEKMLTTCDNADFLEDRSKKRFRKFIEEFYKIIKNEKKVKRLID
jgi:hypothetical protein